MHTNQKLHATNRTAERLAMRIRNCIIGLIAACLGAVSSAADVPEWKPGSLEGHFEESVFYDRPRTSGGNIWYSLNQMASSADGGDFRLTMTKESTIYDTRFYLEGITAHALGREPHDLFQVNLKPLPEGKVWSLNKGHYYLLHRSIYYTVMHIQDMVIQKKKEERKWSADVTLTFRILPPTESLAELNLIVSPETALARSKMPQPMSIGHYYLLRVGELPIVIHLQDFRADQQPAVSFRYFDPRKSTWFGPYEMKGEAPPAASQFMQLAWQHFEKGTSYFSLGLQRAVGARADFAFMVRWNGTEQSSMRCLIKGDEERTYDLGVDAPAVVAVTAEDGFTTNSIAVLNQSLQLAQTAAGQKQTPTASDLPTESKVRVVPQAPPPSWGKLVSDNMLKGLLACAAFVIAFGMSSFFLRDIFPWKKENPRFSDLLSFSTAFFMSGVFAYWLFAAESAQKFIDQITTGFAGVLSTVLSLLFAMIGVYLFWKKVKGYFKIGG